MSKERTVITQFLCDHVYALLEGGLTHKDAAHFAGIGKATVDRIKAAGFNAEHYAKNTADRREAKKAEKQKPAGRYGCVYTGTCELPQTGIELTPEGPIDRETMKTARQLEMDLQQEEQGKYKTPELIAPIIDGTPLNMMRFQAKQADKIRADIQAVGYENAKAIYELKTEMSKIRDLLSQVLKRMDK